MAVSKRTRYEVLRRDDFTCRYCRSKDNELHVDHVTPVSLGGSDKPDNLVAACKDCNAGKGSSAPDGEAVANVEDDAARWAAARARAVKAAAAARAEREAARKPFLDAWMSWDKDGSLLSPDWFDAVDRWLSWVSPSSRSSRQWRSPFQSATSSTTRSSPTWAGSSATGCANWMPSPKRS